MLPPHAGRRLVMALLLTLACSQSVRAQKYKLEDPLPLGVQAKVLSFAGKVTEIKGLVSGVAGKAESLSAALKDLGARTTGMEIRIELASDVLFDFDRADLRLAAAPSLEKVVTVLGAYPSASATIEGHTDNKGNDAYNQRLSERRAESVREWLRAHGASNSMAARGWGAKKPVAPNSKPGGVDDPEGRQKNRRVEIVVKKG